MEFNLSNILADSRTKGWLLVDSPTPTAIYIMIYLFIVWAGPKAMKKYVIVTLRIEPNLFLNQFYRRSPFKLTWLLVPYNLGMAVLNLYIAVQLFTASTRLKYSYVCEPCRQNHDPEELRVRLTFYTNI